MVQSGLEVVARKEEILRRRVSGADTILLWMLFDAADYAVPGVSIYMKGEAAAGG